MVSFKTIYMIIPTMWRGHPLGRPLKNNMITSNPRTRIFRHNTWLRNYRSSTDRIRQHDLHIIPGWPVIIILKHIPEKKGYSIMNFVAQSCIIFFHFGRALRACLVSINQVPKSASFLSPGRAPTRARNLHRPSPKSAPFLMKGDNLSLPSLSIHSIWKSSSVVHSFDSLTDSEILVIT